MDAKQFDSIARALAGQASRRVLTGGFATGALGAAVHLLSQPVEAAKGKKRNEKDNDRVDAEKKRKKKKKKVTLCQNGQTITVNKKAKKKFLRQGATAGACPSTPDCVPTNPNACAGRECGTATNGCAEIPCGECTGSETCNASTGQCIACTPIQNPCGDRVCGTVDNGCGAQVQCGADNGNCPAAAECKAAGVCGNDGQCSYPDEPNNTPCHMNKCTHTCQSGVCTDTPVVCPDDTPCQTYTCDPNDGTCSATDKVCPPAPECQSGPGVCDAQTGECSYTNAPDDTPCGMNKCRNTCQGGVCTQNPVVCSDSPNDCVRDCDPNTGTCLAVPESRPNGVPCNAGSGMCVNSTCEVTNDGTNTCTSANPCLPPTFCNASGTCICYSSIEGAGFCIDQTQAICPSASVRPACASSDECAESEVCVPLKETPDSTTSCCGNGAQFPGFCVPLSARCSQA